MVAELPRSSIVPIFIIIKDRRNRIIDDLQKRIDTKKLMPRDIEIRGKTYHLYEYIPFQDKYIATYKESF